MVGTLLCDLNPPSVNAQCQRVDPRLAILQEQLQALAIAAAPPRETLEESLREHLGEEILARLRSLTIEQADNDARVETATNAQEERFDVGIID